MRPDLKENFVLKACYSWEKNVVVMIIIATHVDDLGVGMQTGGGRVYHHHQEYADAWGRV